MMGILIRTGFVGRGGMRCIKVTAFLEASFIVLRIRIGTETISGRGRARMKRLPATFIFRGFKLQQQPGALSAEADAPTSLRIEDDRHSVVPDSLVRY